MCLRAVNTQLIDVPSLPGCFIGNVTVLVSAQLTVGFVKAEQQDPRATWKTDGRGAQALRVW